MALCQEVWNQGGGRMRSREQIAADGKDAG